MLEDLAPLAPDQIVVPGDAVIWAPFSNEVLARITSEGWPVIRGNHEMYLLDFGTPRAPALWRNPLQYSLLHWQHPRIDPRWRDVVACWPDTLQLRFPGAPLIRVLHDTPPGTRKGIFDRTPEDEAAALLPGVEEPYVVVAHTHLAMDRVIHGRRVLNAGSVGVPLDGDPRAGYMLLDLVDGEWQPTFRRVAYDRAPIYEECTRQGLIEACGPIGELAVEEFRTARHQVSPFLRWREANRPDADVTPELLAEYRASR